MPCAAQDLVDLRVNQFVLQHPVMKLESRAVAKNSASTWKAAKGNDAKPLIDADRGVRPMRQEPAVLSGIRPSTLFLISVY